MAMPRGTRLGTQIAPSAQPPPPPQPPPPEDDKSTFVPSDSYSSISIRQKRSEAIRKKKLVQAIHARTACTRKRERRDIDIPFHPFFCRLHDSDAFCVTSLDALTNSGFASIALALFTLFRPTPFFLHTIILEVESLSKAMIVNRVLLLFIMWFWLALLYTVLVFLGIVLVASRHVQKRNVLLLHPWGLLLMYFDVFVWLSLTIVIHVETENWREARPAFVDRMEYPFVFFLFIYLEVICFALLYYFYATFFIAAELTVIEKFFP